MQLEMQISSSAYMGVETLVRPAVQRADTPCTTQGLAEWLRRTGALAAWDTEVGHLALPLPAEKSGE